jgi:FkbM family methyltransferase
MTHPIETAAEFEGLKVPASRFVTAKCASRITKGVYERPERKLSAKLTQDGDKVVELGSGIGFVGGLTALQKPNLQLRSFEANPHLIPHIEALYEMNGLAHRARVENKLLIANPARPETVTFNLHRSYLGSSVFDNGPFGVEKVDIPTVGWNDVKADFEPDVIIMDIEGAELDFLTHADLSGIRAIIFEVHPAHYGKEGERACLAAVSAQGMRQTHHRMQVYAFVREGVPAPH